MGDALSKIFGGQAPGPGAEAAVAPGQAVGAAVQGFGAPPAPTPQAPPAGPVGGIDPMAMMGGGGAPPAIPGADPQMVAGLMKLLPMMMV